MSLTKKAIDRVFIHLAMPVVRDIEYINGSKKDITLRCTSYNDFIDQLHKDGKITDKQRVNYCIPKYLITRRTKWNI